MGARPAPPSGARRAMLVHELAHAQEIEVRPRHRSRWSDLLYKIIWMIVVLFLIMVASVIGAIYFYIVI
jgi:hypothetical protein